VNIKTAERRIDKERRILKTTHVNGLATGSDHVTNIRIPIITPKNKHIAKKVPTSDIIYAQK